MHGGVFAPCGDEIAKNWEIPAICLFDGGGGAWYTVC